MASGCVASIDPDALSWYEATARQRVIALTDRGSFREFLGPTERRMSPHLPLFDLPRAFDDGIVVGRATLDGSPILIAAQEGRFMGGAFGEVHGGKLVGLLRAALALKQADFTPDRLAAELTACFATPAKLTAAADAARSAGIHDAAERLAEVVVETAART